MSISRNEQFYTVGLPLLFFVPVENDEDPHVIDHVALSRAFSGLTDENGQVLNGGAITTCLTPNEILEKGYVGNLASSEVGGEIKSVEHTASNDGRKETDKIVVTRRSIQLTCGFDEINPTNLKNFFSGDMVAYPATDPVVAKTSARAPQADAADFAVAPIEVFHNAIDTLGPDLSAIEQVLTEKLEEQGVTFDAYDVSGTNYFPGGIYYFIVADPTRQPVVDAKLEPYRNKVLAVFAKYDPAERLMKIQDWLPNMSVPGEYDYVDTTAEARIKQLATDKDANIGIPSNDGVDDRTVMTPYRYTDEWVVNATSLVTQSRKITLPKHIMRQATRIILQGKRWDGSAWVDHSELLFDATQDQAATNNTAPLAVYSGAQHFVDKTTSTVNYVNGDMDIVLLDTFAGSGGDMDTQGLTEQKLTLQIESYTGQDSVILWSGITWGRSTDVYATTRVNRGKPELEGTALVVFNNTVGVSFVLPIPRAVFRPDGTIDFSKEDWMAGSFIIDMLKDERATIPDLPSRLRVPFGYFNTYKRR